MQKAAARQRGQRGRNRPAARERAACDRGLFKDFTFALRFAVPYLSYELNNTRTHTAPPPTPKTQHKMDTVTHRSTHTTDLTNEPKQHTHGAQEPHITCVQGVHPCCGQAALRPRWRGAAYKVARRIEYSAAASVRRSLCAPQLPQRLLSVCSLKPSSRRGSIGGSELSPLLLQLLPLLYRVKVRDRVRGRGRGWSSII